LLVMLFHRGLFVGWVGVQMFFVLSGFLITGILLRSRASSLASYLVTFYGRRALRIFPIYFALLGVLLLLLVLGGISLPGAREGLPSAASYTFNFWGASRSYVPSLTTGHVWSLAVEEQFYLVWPLLLYVCPPRRLPALLVGAVASGPLIR